MRFFPDSFPYAPDWVVLGVNNACNLRCKMCDVGAGYKASNFYHNMTGAKPLNMPRELIFKIIDETARYFPKAKLGYGFTEPLLYPHLVESIRYAKQKRLTTALTTNAFGLERLAVDLALAGLDEVSVSLDGPPEIHNAIRGHARSFAGAFEGIKKIFKIKGPAPEVSIFCAVTEWNIGHLVRFAELFKSFPLRRLGFCIRTLPRPMLPGRTMPSMVVYTPPPFPV
ncbi:MAG: radical SAM protein [Elusimicrobia bacterium]|nr:radical SAM protein [Elusimicrobiota bacterium]